MACSYSFISAQIPLRSAKGKKNYPIMTINYPTRYAYDGPNIYYENKHLVLIKKHVDQLYLFEYWRMEKVGKAQCICAT